MSGKYGSDNQIKEGEMGGHVALMGQKSCAY
jgi:hypothetical protein